MDYDSTMRWRGFIEMDYSSTMRWRGFIEMDYSCTIHSRLSYVQL